MQHIAFIERAGLFPLHRQLADQPDDAACIPGAGLANSDLWGWNLLYSHSHESTRIPSGEQVNKVTYDVALCYLK